MRSGPSSPLIEEPQCHEQVRLRKSMELHHINGFTPAYACKGQTLLYNILAMHAQHCLHVASMIVSHSISYSVVLESVRGGSSVMTSSN